MVPYVGDVKAVSRSLRAAFAVLILSMELAACSQQAETSAPEARPVRTVTVERREAGVPITLTCRIEAEDEVALSFRIAGRILENELKVGDRVEPDQLIARLESQNELNTLRAAKANLSAAQA
jgi:membrane fusion protein, multidrug efflux system